MTIVEELAYESYLRSKGVPFQVVLHAEVDDALEKSDVLEIPTYGVLKAVLLEGEAGEAVAVLPASRRIDRKRLADLAGDRHIRLATEGELYFAHEEFELGALPPSGELLGIPMFVDATVLAHDEVVISSGRRNESLMMKLADLVKGETVTAGLFSEPIGDEHDPYAELS